MVRVQDDLYEYVNADWLSKTEIPSDRPRIGAFDELDINIEKQELVDFQKMVQDDDQTGLLGEFIKFYKMTANWDTRNKLGSKPARELLNKYQNINSLAELKNQLVDLKRQALPTVILPVYIDQDMKNTEQNIVQLGAMGTILPDTTYYEKNGDGERIFELFKTHTTTLLELFGYDKKEATEIVDNAIEYDKKVAQYVLSNEEKSDYWKLYNPKDFKEFTNQIKNVDLADVISTLVDKTPDIINIEDVNFWQHYDELVNEENFVGIKATLIIDLVGSVAPFLSDEIRIQNGAFGRALSGTTKPRSKQKAALSLAHNFFNPVVGDYYGRKYFGEVAKKDVLDMVKKMIAVFEQRLQTNDWLGEDTKQKALLKLSTIGLNVGYPDNIPARYSKFVVDENADLLANARRFQKLEAQHDYSKLNVKPDKTEWEMPADMVNAYYHPFHNIIVFPAAILQAPFYSLKQSKSANYGGIGAVIAHEISHAFDTNGARFDEKGNLNGWWTDEDFAAFEKRTDAMVQEFDGLENEGAVVNGKLVVSENVADVGGLSVALEAAKAEDDTDLTAFFSNWASVWRSKASIEYMKLIAKVDVHAPARLRANVQVTNFEDFFETFNVTPDDKMWRDQDKRVKIW